MTGSSQITEAATCPQRSSTYRPLKASVSTSSPPIEIVL
jgi:hypothetical protein